ncbi:MAG: Sulfate permease 2, partial [Chaenotheca gracillima]
PGQHLGSGAIMGCANYHGWLIFDNDDRWLVRIPRDPFSDLPASLIEYLVVSEYATLKFLEGTSVPAPRVFGYGLASEERNDVGVSFLIMEALPGKPFNAHQTSLEQKERVFSGVADILIELSKHPLPKAGSLILRADAELEVGPTASNRFVALGLYGPFGSATEYFVSITEQYLDLIADGQLYPSYAVESFLIYRFLEENLHRLASGELDGQFYLKHVDDKGDHLLVDEQGNVTGIIDWQFARSVPACEAFGPSLFTSDLDSLYSSNSGITQDDQRLAKMARSRGAEMIAGFLGGNEMARRFHLGLASGMTRAEVWEMIKGLHAAFSSSPPSSLEEWKQDAMKKCGQDPRLVNLLQQQNRIMGEGRQD